MFNMAKNICALECMWDAMISYAVGYWTLFHSTNCGAWLQERPRQGGQRTKTRRCQQDAKCALVAIAEALFGWKWRFPKVGGCPKILASLGFNTFQS